MVSARRIHRPSSIKGLKRKRTRHGFLSQRRCPNGLEFRLTLHYLDAVTAIALIDQIKALPLDEQAKVIDALEELKSAQVHQVRTLEPKTFEQTTQRVFERHEALMQKLSQ